MSSTYTEPLDRLEECLDQVAAIDPTYRTTAEKQEALLRLSALITRAQAEQLRVLAVADDIAETTGDRSTATWLAEATRDAHPTLRRHARLATALDQHWTQLATALAAGQVNLAQTRVITEALDALPTDLGEDLLTKAEALLVQEAANLGPRELRTFGSRVLHYLAPETADQAEYQALLAAETRADAATRLTLRPRGDGSTDLHARLPDHIAGRLSAYLNACTAPRRRHLNGSRHSTGAGSEVDELARLPIERQRGIAFTALLENIPTDALPRHGGTATTLMVTIDHDALRADLAAADFTGTARTSTGHRITAGQARRLACQAQILPAVLGTESEILDLGRESRLFKPHQRKALNARDQECTTRGCTMPAAFCEAHHKVPWAQGGSTDLDDGILLCPFHHHRAHDPAWNIQYHPDGTTTFTRRQHRDQTNPNHPRPDPAGADPCLRHDAGADPPP